MLNFLILQVASDKSSSIPQFILIGGILVVFYFFMIRPQQKRQKEQRTFLDTLKKGDKVITIGGIHGKVHDVSEDTVTLEIDSKGSKVTCSRAAISIDATKRHTTTKTKK